MKYKKLPIILLAMCLAFLLGSTSSVFAATLSNADLQAGQVKAEKIVTGPDSDGNYTISLSVIGKNKEVTTPSNADVVLVMDNSGSMEESGGICGCKEFDMHYAGITHLLKHYVCKKCGTEYKYNKPKECTNPLSSRIDIAKEVGKTFAKDILTSDSDNRMAVIGFSGQSIYGGANETGAIKVSQSLTKNLSSVTGAIEGMRANGGTNYTAALNQAYSYLKNRKGDDAKRPGYVIFISDGAPGPYGESQNDSNFNGKQQAAAIKALPAKLYTIGIALDQSASNYMASLASDTGHYKNVTSGDYEAQLAEIMKEWAEQINSVPAGSNATMNDIVNTDKFEVVETSSGLVSQQADGSYSWNIGDIVEKSQTQTIKIKPIDSGVNIPTNDDVTLKYTDADGNKVTKGKADLGDPSVSVAKVTFKVEHGSWKDRSAEKTVLVPLDTETGLGTLSANDVPSGMAAEEGYTNGHWVVTPNTDKDGITGDVTYTYAFDAINYANVTFKVENGTWADGTTEAKTESVALSRDGKGTLSEDAVPTGMKAADGYYEDGHWDATPNTDKDGITDDVTYTYSFDAVEHATVTFKVENGTWADGTTEAKTESVALSRDGKGTLSEDAVPTGMKAADGYYEDGHWDATPNTDKDGITDDVTYTYSFDAVEHATVTFKVENGTWAEGTTEAKTESVALSRDGKGTLSEDAVPTGMKALDGYENGAWKEAPNTDKDAITGDVTYTYSFDKKPPVITKATATFKVVNGTWSDGSSEDKTTEVTLADGTGTLDVDEVPTGMIASDGYEGGGWDVTPNTVENSFTGDVTYTYSFTKKPPVITQGTVTFKVVNGTWEDGTTEDKYATVTLTDGYGTLSAGEVPTGMKPNDKFEGGAWDVVPNTATNGISGNITYTYTFTERQPVISQATVTYKVVNGTWSDGTSADKTETITLLDGVGTLPQATVPTGMFPNDRYEGGAWDVTPNTAENAVTQDVTYTYSFTEEEIIVPDDDPTPQDDPDDGDDDSQDKDPGDKNPPAKDEEPAKEPKEHKTSSETKTVTKQVTKTDDTRENSLWILLMILSTFGISGLAYYQRKKVH